jgi:hypothetical protein
MPDEVPVSQARVGGDERDARHVGKASRTEQQQALLRNSLEERPERDQARIFTSRRRSGSVADRRDCLSGVFLLLFDRPLLFRGLLGFLLLLLRGLMGHGASFWL